jgi:type VI secretion system protein ImpC
MLWANGSILAGLLLGKTFSEQGVPGMRLGTIMSLSDVPFYYYNDADGDQIALPNTERLVSEAMAAHAIAQHLMPILCVRGRPEVRLGSFQSLAGSDLAGSWAPVAIEPDEKAPQGQAADQPDDSVPTVEAYESQAVSAAEAELDALLAGLMADVAAPVGPVAEADVSSGRSESSAGARDAASTPASDESPAGSSTDDLDALLQGIASNEAEQTSDSSDMDPDLAALLASL